MKSCFKNIVGISRTECDCFTDEFNADAAISKSGLFIDEATERFSLAAFSDGVGCGETLQGIVEKSRVDGINEFILKLSQEVGTMYKTKTSPYNGKVGSASATGDRVVNDAIVGLVVDVNASSGVSINVNAITPYFNYTGVITISVYKAYRSNNLYQSPALVDTIVLNTTSGTPIKQSLTSKLTLDSEKDVSYLFMYELDPGQYPKNNNNICGCGQTEALLHKYVHPYSIEGADVNALDPTKKKGFINGLLLDITAQCSIEDLICDNYYENTLLQTSINHAILYLSASKLLIKLLRSDIISRYTMMDREAMQEDAYVLQGKATKSINWIAQNMKVAGDCFVCQGDNIAIYKKRGILL